jgi:hypothetical protein
MNNEIKTFIEEIPNVHLFVDNDADRLKVAWDFGLNQEQQIKYPLKELTFEKIIEADDIDLDDYRDSLETKIKIEFRIISENTKIRLSNIDDKIPFINALKNKITNSKKYLEKQVIKKDSFEALPSKVLQISLSELNELLERIEDEHISFEREIWENFFTKQIHYINFKKYISSFILEYHTDYSFIFQKMLKKKLIYRIKHKEFIEWLFKHQFINQSVYEELDLKKNLISFDKSSSDDRENNFNKTFGF